MSVFGRIQFALDMHEGKKQLNKLNRVNRAAGAKNYNEANKPSDISTGHQNESSEKNSNPANENKQKKTKWVKVEDPPKKNKKEEKSEPKTEQQINAEAQAPEETPGAEQVTVENIAQDISPAAMASHVHISEPQPGVLNMNGVLINTRDVMQKPNVQPNPYSYNPTNPVQMNSVSIPVQNVPSQYPAEATQGNPFMQQYAQRQPIPANQGNPMIPQNIGFSINPVPGADIYAQRMMQQPYMNPQPQPGIGHHKVDKPDIKPPKPPKAEPDKIDMTGMPNPGAALEVQKFETIDARTHGVLEDKISKEVTKVEPKSIFPSNVEMCRKYPYLVEVEKTALDNGYQVAFAESPNGLILCHIADPSGNYIDNKGFTIDPGLIIDHRKKVFPGTGPFYEGLNAYPLFINSGGSKDKKEKKQSSNVFNEELIKGLIVGGNQTVSNARGMYTEEFRNLNSIIALITIPTKNNSPADRKYIQNRLVDLYKGGVFNEALALNPNTRFRVVDYDSGTGTIILDNYLTLKNFGGQFCGQVYSGERIQFKITKDKCKMLRGDNLIQIE